MLLSYQSITNPSSTSFTVSFEFLNLADIKAVGKLNSASEWTELPVTDAATNNGVTTVTVADAGTYSSAGAIRIYRASTQDPLVDFQNGSRLSESDLDTAYRQGLFAAQEVRENAADSITAVGPQGPAGTNGVDGADGADGTSASNSPTFAVRLSTDQSVPNQSATKLTLDTEDWDTDSAWDTTNYNFTVPSGQAGRYCFNGHVRILAIWGHNSNSHFSQVQIRVNDANKAEHRVYDTSATTKDLDLQVSKVLNLAVGDVVDFRVYHNGAGQQNQNISSGAAQTWFTGFKLA